MPKFEMRHVISLMLVAIIAAGIGASIWLIGGAQVTSRESALIGVLLTFLSIVATWLVAHLYSESQRKQAIEEVKELHRASLETYALKAAEKVDNLSTELNRLSVYLTNELESEDDDEPAQTLHSRDERIMSAIHILHTLKSVNDTALSDWQGVIGEEIEQQREQRREWEETLREIVSEIESAVTSKSQVALGDQLYTDALRSELLDLRSELRQAIVEAGASPAPYKPRRRKVLHPISVPCPKCDDILSYRQRESDRSVKAVNCNSCESRWVSLFSNEKGFYLEPRRMITETVVCPRCDEPTQVELDSCPGTSVVQPCPACEELMRAVRTREGVDVRITAVPKSKKPRTKLTPEFLEAVKKLMPTQPWPTGVHKIVAKKLGVTPSAVSRANHVLISRGDFLPQFGGIVYAPVEPVAQSKQPNPDDLDAKKDVVN